MSGPIVWVRPRRRRLGAACAVGLLAAIAALVPRATMRPTLHVRTPPVARVVDTSTLPAWATRPDRPPGRIAGRVVDEDGDPVPAIVHLRLAEHPELWRGVDVATGAGARFDLGLWPAGAYQLIAEAPGLGSRVVDIRSDGGAGNEAQDGGDAELVLRTCEPVHGVVTANGAPVVGATIAHGGVPVARSGADGRFAACVTEPWLDVRAPGRALASEFAVDEHDGELVAQMSPTRRIVGRVVDEHGAPRPGALVAPVIADPGPLADYPGASEATTDADGRFALELPIDGPHRYTLWVHVHDRFAPFGELVDARGPLAITVRDADLLADDPTVYVARLRGRVMRDGRPVADAWVEAGPARGGLASTTRTRADGRFELALEASQLGAVDVDASGPTPDGADATRHLRVRAGQRVQLGTLRLAR